MLKRDLILIFGVLTPLSTIFQLYHAWRPVLVVEEAGVPGESHLPQGRIQGTHPAPPKIGKNMTFMRKIVIFHTKYPQKNC